MGSMRDRIQQFEDKAKATTESDRTIQQGRDKTTLSIAKRLPTNLLEAAGVPTSKNPLLLQIWNAVQEYNADLSHPSTLSTPDAHHRIAELDIIMYWSGEYMTSKWAKDATTVPDAKRVKRWEALKDLLTKIPAELKLLGVKALIGPADWTQISNTKRSYWLERLDPNHRPGWVLSAIYAVWLQNKPTDNAGKPQAFFDWVASPAGQAALLSKPLANNKVGYDDTYEPLWKRSVFFEAGHLKKTRNDHLFTTRGRRTEFSQDGWAIWVCSSARAETGQNHIFSHSHEAGIFHHSTFLSGFPVLAAGEWIVDDGVVKVITAKSGHYQPSVDDMLRFVGKFSDIPRNAIIRPDLVDFRSGANKVLFYRVGDFLSLKTNATPIKKSQFLSMVPGWANKNIMEDHQNQTTLKDLLPT